MTGPSRLRHVLRRSWDTISLAVLVSALLAASAPLGRVAASIPRGVLSVTLVLIGIQLLIEIRASSHAATGGAAPALAPVPVPAVSATTPGLAALWLVGLLTAVLLLGTTLGSRVFSFAYLRWHAGARFPTSIGLALGIGASVQLIFGLLLQATLYPGWLWHLVR